MNLWERIKNNKLVLGFLIFDFIAVIILIIFNILNLFRSATVDISVVPLDATVTINGKKYDNNSSYNVFPSSNVKVEISHPDLESKAFTVDLEQNSTTSIREYLTGKNGDFSFYLKKSQEKNIDPLENIASSFPENKKLQSFMKKIKIKNILPISYEECGDEADKYSCFSLFINSGYYKDCDQLFCIAVSDSSKENHSDLCEKLISEKGFSLSDYKVIYENETIEYLEENP